MINFLIFELWNKLSIILNEYFLKDKNINKINKRNKTAIKSENQ